MGKFKTALVSLGVLAVILGCGMLPGLAALVTDRITQNAPGSAPIQGISLTPTEPVTDTMQYYLDRLALQGDMYSMPVNADMASMTADEVLDAAREQMMAFHSFGIVQFFDDADAYAEPHIAIASADVDHTAVYWTVRSNPNTVPNDYLLLQMDDATGKLLSIAFEHSEVLYADLFPEERLAVIEQLATVFMDLFAPENKTLTSRIFDVNRVELSENAIMYDYTLSGLEENQTRYVTIHVTLYDRGFQIDCTSF